MITGSARRCLAGLAVLFGFTGCSSATAGHAAKSDVPAQAYDVRVFLCPADTLPGSACTRPATPQETDALRNQLVTDDHVENLLYLSAAEAYRVAKLVVPGATTIGPAELPPTFLLQLTDVRADERDVLDRYRHAAGVETVTACATTGAARALCAVRTLRAAGVLN